MAPRYYFAQNERGNCLVNPSKTGLFRMIDALNASDNTCIVIRPGHDEPACFASVTLLDDGGFEVVRRDSTRGEHGIATYTSIRRIVEDLTIWMTSRITPVRRVAYRGGSLTLGEEAVPQLDSSDTDLDLLSGW